MSYTVQFHLHIFYVHFFFLFRYTGDPGKLAHLQVADEGLGGMLTSVSLVVM